MLLQGVFRHLTARGEYTTVFLAVVARGVPPPAYPHPRVSRYSPLQLMRIPAAEIAALGLERACNRQAVLAGMRRFVTGDRSGSRGAVLLQ